MNRSTAVLLAALLLGCAAMSPGCSSQGAGCEPHARRACSGGVLYWVDACGQQEENIRICPRGCAPSGDACLDEPDGGPEEADGGWDDGGAPDEGLPEGDDGGAAADDGGPTEDDGGPEPDDGAEPAVTIQTVFSVRPADNGRDDTVEDAIVDLIQRAVPGSRIRVAIYTFTRDRVADELVAAHLRGVDVKVLLDGGAPDVLGSEVGTLQAGLGMDRVHLCDAPGTSCLGTGIMHHKTFLFSELSDGSRNVVLQASHNLTHIQLNLHNNAVIVRNDDRLFESYQQTFEDMWQDVENDTYYHYDNGSGPARVYYFPKGSGSDPVVSILNNVRCDATARIRVLSAFFTHARRAVAQALAARQADGCDVAVVASTAENNLGADVQSTLTAGGVTLVPYPERTGGWTIHSKVLLIDAPFEGSTGHRRLVFCGSHNWTGPALWSNDETMLRIEDDGVFQAFLDDWARTRAAADRP
jgi:phosphatidylserine/phosphatidylglycerophosphate/cardiolipin synthase-like enzyme